MNSPAITREFDTVSRLAIVTGEIRTPVVVHGVGEGLTTSAVLPPASTNHKQACMYKHDCGSIIIIAKGVCYNIASLPGSWNSFFPP